MLTKRLAACAALVTPGGVVCDVGTDHAYLPAELLRRGQCTRAVATDIHAGPLEAAKRTLTEAGVLEQAELFLCDGLAQVQPEGITDVVIAGMGGETIIHILEDCPWRRQVHLILQPMTKIPDLRRWLAEQGFSWTEQAVQDYVMQGGTGEAFLKKLNDLLEFVIPKYEQEGKTQLVIAIGCTGGRHRSVTIAGEVFKRLTESGRYEIRLEHRDAGKDGGK